MKTPSQLIGGFNGRKYKAFTLAQCATRPGSLDILKLPSVFGTTRIASPFAEVKK